ncbi:MAG: FtsX-like permease family protein, partial [Gemmatimonadetes bacterium]|nr:FtsX-like permease family protein [Gemmatimonadota bacterium]
PGESAPIYREVIGVARNVRHYELETPSRIQVYLPYQGSRTQTGMDMSIIVRTSVPPEQLVGGLRRELASLDPDAPLALVTTMEEYVDRAMQSETALGGILATFSGLAMLLAGIGIFGVLSYTVLQRTPEIGIRMALGADARSVRRWIALEGLLLAGIGIGIGVVAALGLTQLLRGFLFSVDPIDLSVYAALAVFLLVVTVAATYIPAARATRVDPATVLRSQE